jgi:multiple sugar transport system substrate-binding protein
VRLSRRAFLRLGPPAAAALVASIGIGCGERLAPVARGTAPTPGSGLGGTLQILQWSHFVPGYDDWFIQFAQDWGAQHNVAINLHKADAGLLTPTVPQVDSSQRVAVDTLPHLTLPARFAAELAANHGHDLIQFATLVKTHLYASHLLDLSELCEKLGQRYGPWLPSGRALGQVDGIWRGYPDFYQAEPPIYRADLFQQVGLGAPRTWEDLRTAGRLLKPLNHPAGMAVSHCNDANHNWRAVMWSYGASEVGADGQTITVNSPAMREALTFMKALFDDAMTPEVFAWDDSSNNKYLVSRVAGWIHDAISAIRIAEVITPELVKSIAVTPEVAGPAGRLSCVDANVYAIWRFAQNQPAALTFLEYYAEHWKDSFVASQGFNLPFLQARYAKPMPVLGEDPQVQVLQDFYPYVQVYGYPGPPNAAAEETLNAFIIPDMVRQVLRGDSPDAAISWAEGELRRIYRQRA